MADTTNAEVARLSYEQARDELVEVVTRLEQGAATLEESLALWERGEALAAHCEEWLLGAKARLEAARRSSGAAADAPATGGEPSPAGPVPDRDAADEVVDPTEEF